MNSCNFTGRLTRMPEVRKTNSGMSVCRFRLAVRRTFKTNGEYLTDFLDFVAWNEKAELVGRYFGQGQLIAVEAEAQTRSYENNRGDRIVAVEFIVNRVESLVQRTSKEEAAEQGTGTTVASDTRNPSTADAVPLPLGKGGYENGDFEQDGFLDIGNDEDLPF